MNVRISLLLPCLLSGALTSCHLIYGFDDCDNDRLIIEPPCCPMFQYDDDGIPCRYDQPELPAMMQEDLKNEFFGYGWRWMHTDEIDSTGAVYAKSEDFYSTHHDLSPMSYYFKSDTEMTMYFHPNTVNVNHDAYLQHGYAADLQLGILSDGNQPLAIRPWSFYIRIWNIYSLSGKWHIDCIEPLCYEFDDDGQRHIIWGTSHYVRMTSNELRKMQQQYSFDYSQVN